MIQENNFAGCETAPVASEPQPGAPITSAGSPLAVVYREIFELKLYQGNARTHSKAQIRKIAESIRSFGFTNPILIDAQDRIVAGHGRVQAAKLLKMATVPTIRLESLTPAQVRAYVLADNRLAEDAGWDQEILKIELQNIILDGEIDVSLTGFEIGEIDLIIGQVGDSDSDDEISEVQEEAVTRPGDLWLLGPHRLYCGDARSEVSFSTLLGDTRASVAFCDVPFNVPIHGHASGNGKTLHPEFAMASGEMSEEEFTSFLQASLAQLSAWSKNGSVHYVAMDWRHMGELQAAGKAVYGSLLNVCVWTKGTGGMGSFYRSEHEMIFVFRNGNAPHKNTVQLGRYGRNRTNVWRYPGANSFSRSGDEGNLLEMHPTVKPVALIADAILDCSARGDIVLDSFLGSGSTLMAAERVGRICYGIEIEPRYVDLAIRRWQRLTGGQAIHGETGRPFEDMSAKEGSHG